MNSLVFVVDRIYSAAQNIPSLCSHMETLGDMTEGFVGEYPDCLRWALPAVGHLKKASPSPAHPNSLSLGTDPFTHILPLTRGMLYAFCKCTRFFSASTTNQNHFPLETTCFHAVQYRNVPYLQLIWMSNSDSHVFMFCFSTCTSSSSDNANCITKPTKRTAAPKF